MVSKGLPDIPVAVDGVDLFNIGRYIECLASFIKECDTPMTIAIQGDWGTGKTSMMNMIQGIIQSDVKTVNFNTWQYSQFNFGDQLPILLLDKLIRTLEDSETTKRTRDIICKLSKGIASVALGRISNGVVDETAFSMDLDFVDQLINLQKNFQDAINEQARKTKGRRVVIFIDDLDRLQPEKAVELLEVMKLFLDCKNCVFVLAIDYSVVSQGIKAKFGQNVSEEKGRSFFDKIIQLPFKMPVAQYSIDNYLCNLMTDIWGEIEENEHDDVRDYISIIDNTIGKNPRSIKRTVNSFAVINKVAEKENAFACSQVTKKNKQKLLFALLCIQLSFEPLYNYLLQNAEELQRCGKQFIDALRDDSKLCEILKSTYRLEELPDTSSDLFKRADGVIEVFCDWCEALCDNRNYDNVVSVLMLSSITSNEVSSTRRSVQYGTLEQIVAQVKTKEKIVNCYKAFEECVKREFGADRITAEGTLGQSCIVFKCTNQAIPGRKRNIMEVKFLVNSVNVFIYKLRESKPTVEQLKMHLPELTNDNAIVTPEETFITIRNVSRQEHFDEICSLFSYTHEYIDKKCN